MKTIFASLLLVLLLIMVLGHVLPCATLASRVTAELAAGNYVQALRLPDELSKNRPCLCGDEAKTVLGGALTESVHHLSAKEDFTTAINLVTRYFDQVKGNPETGHLISGLQQDLVQFIRSTSDSQRALDQIASARGSFQDKEMISALAQEEPRLLESLAYSQIEKGRHEDAIRSFARVLRHPATSAGEWQAAQAGAAKATAFVAHARLEQKDFSKAFAAVNEGARAFAGSPMQQVIEQFDLDVFGRSLSGAQRLASPLSTGVGKANLAEVSVRNPSDRPITVIYRGPTGTELNVPAGGTAKTALLPGSYLVAAFGGAAPYRGEFLVNRGSYVHMIETTHGGSF